MLTALVAFGVIPQSDAPPPPDDEDLGLITLEEARVHLREPDPLFDADIILKGRAASEIVIDYIKRPDHGWDASTAPRLIKAATLLVLGALYDDREGGDPLSGAVQSILRRHRDPTLQ